MGAPENTQALVNLPELIDIPAGAPSKECSCGARLWWVMHHDKRIPVACPPFIVTKAIPRLDLPTRAPTSREHGRGINHYIDCPDRKKFGKASAHDGHSPATAPPSTRPATSVLANVDAPKPEPPVDPESHAAKVRAAEALSEAHGLRCSGAPFLPEACNGFAVCVLKIDRKLFATPCVAHADTVTDAVIAAGRKRSLTVHAVDELLGDYGPSVAAKFVARAAQLRAMNHRNGFQVPSRGALVILW
jgi:hypothetical protein